MFNIYVRPLLNIIKNFGLQYHNYADDSQIYFRLDLGGHNAAAFQNCMIALDHWMLNNFLKLNTTKTEIIFFGPCTLSQSPSANIWPTKFGTCPSPSLWVRNLGVLLDARLTMNNQVNKIIKECAYQLRLLKQLLPFLPEDCRQLVINAIISSRLDYCNSVLLNLPAFQINRLQKMQNSAARLVSGTARREHIKPILAALHWLPVKQRIDFKIATLVHKAIFDHRPSYLSEMFHSVAHVRNLRSNFKNLLQIPRHKRNKIGGRALSVAGARLWNNLPDDLRATEDHFSFRRKLKTALFSQAFTSV